MTRQGRLDLEALGHLHQWIFDPCWQGRRFGASGRRISIQMTQGSQQQKYPSCRPILAIIGFHQIDSWNRGFLQEIVQGCVLIELLSLGGKILDHIGIGLPIIGTLLHGVVAFYRPKKALAALQFVFPGIKLALELATQSTRGRKAPFFRDKPVFGVAMVLYHRLESRFDLGEVVQNFLQLGFVLVSGTRCIGFFLFQCKLGGGRRQEGLPVAAMTLTRGHFLCPACKRL